MILLSVCHAGVLLEVLSSWFGTHGAVSAGCPGAPEYTRRAMAEHQTDTDSNARALRELLEADEALFRAIAGWHAPVLDRIVPTLSNTANNSMLWIASAVLLSIFGGKRGRLVAVEALVTVAVTSATANLAAKQLVPRERPTSGVPSTRRLEQPKSSSFPSGHTASAAAFSGVVGQELPHMYVPATSLAAAVGFSRVYTGVHYPGDVLFGWILGRGVAGLVRMLWPRRWRSGKAG